MENLNDIYELKELILSSKEYVDYKNSLKLVEDDKEINDLIKKIISIQKLIVKKESQNQETINLNEELDNLYSNLYGNKKYSSYIEKSKRLNQLITRVQKRLNDYFDSLVS